MSHNLGGRYMSCHLLYVQAILKIKMFNIKNRSYVIIIGLYSIILIGILMLFKNIVGKKFSCQGPLLIILFLSIQSILVKLTFYEKFSIYRKIFKRKKMDHIYLYYINFMFRFFSTIIFYVIILRSKFLSLDIFLFTIQLICFYILFIFFEITLNLVKLK